MEVLVTETARDYVKAHGGTVYVRAHPHRCCTGSLTLLDSTTKPPRDVAAFLSVTAGDIHVKFRGGASGHPHQLMIKVAGLLRRHLVALWDGCAVKP